MTHDAEIHDQKAPAFLELGLRGAYLDSGQIRATPHHESALAPHAAASQGDFPVGFVGGNGDVGGSESQPFSPAHQLVSEIMTLEFRLVKLGVQVVVVEDESHAKELEEPSDQKNRVGRIARLEDAESGSCVHPQ